MYWDYLFIRQAQWPSNHYVVSLSIYWSNFCGRTFLQKNGHIFSIFKGSLQPHFLLYRNNFCISGLLLVWPPQIYKVLCLLFLSHPYMTDWNFEIGWNFNSSHKGVKGIVSIMQYIFMVAIPRQAQKCKSCISRVKNMAVVSLQS